MRLIVAYSLLPLHPHFLLSFPPPFSFPFSSPSLSSSLPICLVGVSVSSVYYHISKRWPRSEWPAHIWQVKKNSQAEYRQHRRITHRRPHTSTHTHTASAARHVTLLWQRGITVLSKRLHSLLYLSLFIYGHFSCNSFVKTNLFTVSLETMHSTVCKSVSSTSVGHIIASLQSSRFVLVFSSSLSLA